MIRNFSIFTEKIEVLPIEKKISLGKPISFFIKTELGLSTTSEIRIFSEKKRFFISQTSGISIFPNPHSSIATQTSETTMNQQTETFSSTFCDQSCQTEKKTLNHLLIQSTFIENKKLRNMKTNSKIFSFEAISSKKPQKSWQNISIESLQSISIISLTQNSENPKKTIIETFSLMTKPESTQTEKNLQILSLFDYQVYNKLHKKKPILVTESKDLSIVPTKTLKKKKLSFAKEKSSNRSLIKDFFILVFNI